MNKKDSPPKPPGKIHHEIKEPTWINGRLVFPVYQKQKDLDPDTYLALMHVKKDLFGEDQDPIHVLETFLIAHENGVIPPAWIYDYLAQGFRTFLKSDGRKTLDFFLGFQPGKGPGDSPFKKRYLKERDFILCLDMFRLQDWFGYSQYKAAEMVSRKLEEIPDWNRTRFAFKKPQADYLRDQYSRRWKKRLMSRAYSPLIRAIQKTPQKTKQFFLKSFPQD